MYNYFLLHGRKHFYRYCLQAFSTKKIWKCNLKDCFKINIKSRIIIPKKGKNVKIRNFSRKINPPFINYTDFENILVPENNGKQNPEESYTEKYQKHIACSYGYKLLCIDGKFAKNWDSWYNSKDL